MRKVDLNDAISAAVQFIGPEAIKRGVAVNTNLVQGAPLVRADKIQLQQVLLNLALNGMDAMANGVSGSRTLSIETALPSESEVEVSVSDSGPGIPLGNLNKVFDTFYTTKTDGTGLGLSISRTIVETYGGEIRAENRPEGGAIFRFTLPLSEQTHTMSDRPPIIHIIDDNASFRIATGNLLRACHYRVAYYKSATQFLEQSPNDEPACILLDVHMPDLSGPQLQDQLAGLGFRLPIIFVTGDGDIPTSVQTIKAGAEDFLTKPISKERLLEAIKQALSHLKELRERGRAATALRSVVSRLTPREHDIFTLLARGWPHKKIAHSFGTSAREPSSFIDIT